jgi:hypothetical protein
MKPGMLRTLYLLAVLAVAVIAAVLVAAWRRAGRPPGGTP